MVAARWTRSKAVSMIARLHERKKDVAFSGAETTNSAQWKACPEAFSPQDTPDARIPQNLTARLHRRDGENPSHKKINRVPQPIVASTP
jgi:hypothetical protein